MTGIIDFRLDATPPQPYYQAAVNPNAISEVKMSVKQKKSKTITITIRMTAEQHAAIHQAARADQRSMASYVLRQAVMKATAENDYVHSRDHIKQEDGTSTRR